MYPQEGLLEYILGIGTAAQHPAQVSVQGFLITPDQGGESVRIAARGLRHQFLVTMFYMYIRHNSPTGSFSRRKSFIDLHRSNPSAMTPV